MSVVFITMLDSQAIASGSSSSGLQKASNIMILDDFLYVRNELRFHSAAIQGARTGPSLAMPHEPYREKFWPSNLASVAHLVCQRKS
ncbi:MULTISPECIES: hypothetical protein [unclassified Novosphingobium]|uniref:hypothetical protein n=1 Tax=unclassified Novosphingobium TaxID=2644732 RepID=UPI0013578573|nr:MULTISPECIES: hypothetical protein [unclassified Novosphingobium]